MNFNKIFTISLILMVLSISLGVACASSSEPIDLGEITSSDFQITGVSAKNSMPSPVTSSPAPSTQLYDVDFTANFEIDTSKMSDADKKLLTEAVKDKNTSFIMNMSSDNHKVTVELYQGADISLNGDTLKMDASTYYSSIDGSSDVKVDSVGLRTSDNQLFVAKMNK